MIHVLDLNFLGFQHAIASFLVETSAGPILIETGPHSTYRTLSKMVEKTGFRIQDIKHVFLSHIHLDHAGAAWAFAEMGAKIYVHPFGASHLQHPHKLMESARMIYKDQMDRLWGDMKETPGHLIYSPDDGEGIKIGDKIFNAIYTPGHAKHHISWKLDNAIFAGDVAGVKIGDGPVVPPCPPPDINLEDWNCSIDIILKSAPDTIYLTHFGPITSIDQHFQQLRFMLNDWAQWIKVRWESGLTAEEITPLFSRYTEDQLISLGVSKEGVNQYEAANPSWMSVAGLIRYWKKKSESRD